VVERSADLVEVGDGFTALTLVANAPTDSVMKSGCGEAVIRISRTSATSLAFLTRRSCRIAGGDASTYSAAVRMCPRKWVNSRGPEAESNLVNLVGSPTYDALQALEALVEARVDQIRLLVRTH
jgi:hypothetical protein